MRALTVGILVACATLASVANARPTGAPTEACSTLTPNHPDIIPLPCVGCGFELVVEAQEEVLRDGLEPEFMTYRCGQTHTVTIFNSNSSTFRGFMVQSRVFTEEFEPQAPFLGTFRPSASAQLLTCDDNMGGTVTHVDPMDKTFVELSWTAPFSEDPQPITFWYTVVVRFELVYVQLSVTLFPDEISCSVIQPPPPPEELTFTLGRPTLVVQEGSPVEVCVVQEFQEGRFQQATVRLFTQDGIGAVANKDYQSADQLVEFFESSIMCIENFTTAINDSVTETDQQFFVLLEFNSEVIDEMRVHIVDGITYCPADEFLCAGEPRCLPEKYVCDGISDCLRREDEFFCDTDPCSVEGSYRLRGGPTPREGLVELCYEGEYRSICLENVSPPDAALVCEALGFLGGGMWVSAWQQYNTFGSGAQIERCTGNETTPLNCTFTMAVEDVDCSHVDDVGLRCQDEIVCEHGSVRLVGGPRNSIREGAVQLCLYGVWVSLSSSDWEFKEARVVCRSLGFDEFGALPIPRVPYSNVSNDAVVFTEDVECQGTEFSLTDCTLDPLNVDDDDDDGYVVGVRCDDLPVESNCVSGDVRLRERLSETQGLVEVCMSGSWTAICSGFNNIAIAKVVCRQLNSSAVGLPDIYLESQGEFTAGLEFLSCTGSEANLLQCQNEIPMRRKRQTTCFAGTVVGVRCPEPPRVFASPPTASGNYERELRREYDNGISCFIDPNQFYAQSTNLTLYRVEKGNRLVQIETRIRSQGLTVVPDGFVDVSDGGMYLCKAVNEAGASNVTFNISIEDPSGPRSRVYMRLSLPHAGSRLVLIFQYGEVGDILFALEQFLILNALDPEKSPGLQTANCSFVNRTEDDEVRIRDRYECVIDNYPPLEGNPTALAVTVAAFLEAQTFPISDIKISESGFCDSEPSVYEEMWPETEAGDTAALPCEEGGVVTRLCSPGNGGQWMPPNEEQCGAPSTTSPSTQPPTSPPTTSTEFCCTSEDLCLPANRACDGVGHCLQFEDEAFCPPVMTGCTDGEVRLSQGVSGNDGIIELCINESWGGLCEQRFSPENARVTCRKLGLPEGVVVLRHIQSLVPVHPISLSCTGSEDSLLACDRSPIDVQKCAVNLTRAAIECQAPAQCEDGELRLIGGADDQEGNLQVCFNQVWGSVCHSQDGFSLDEARVACNQLGYNPSGALVLPDGYLGLDSVTPLIRYTDCDGDESKLTECLYSDEGSDQCLPVQIRCDAYPTDNCVEGSVRLIDRLFTSEGMLELCYNGQWGTVCNEPFSDPDAEAICRQLGFGLNINFNALESGLQAGVSYGERRRNNDTLVHNLEFLCGATECEFEPSLFSCPDDLSVYLLCPRRPSSYLIPPPSGDNNVYMIERGQEIELGCRSERTYPPSTTIIYRVGEGSEDMCIPDDRVSSDSSIEGSPSEGNYQCVSCNELGNTVINFTIETLTPKGEGSSVFLRLSVPVVDRLSILVQSEIEQEELLPGLESLISTTDVISEADGIQSVECRFVERISDDIEAQRNRYECNITTYPPTDTGEELVERMANEIRRERITIASALLISETGFCDMDVDVTDWGTYDWPETTGNSREELMCVEDSSIIVTRNCMDGGIWDRPVYGGCALLGLRGVSPDENFGETSALVVSAVQEAEQTDDNVRFVRDYLMERVAIVLNNASAVDEEFVENVVDILGSLQEWPEDALQADNTGSQIVQSFETITISLTQQENFTELEVEDENIAVRIENVNIDDITTGRSLGVSEGNGNLNASVGSDSSLAPNQIASGFLPLSLFQLATSDSGDPIPVVFAVFRTGRLFSIEGNQGTNPDISTTVGSAVVSLTVGVNRTFRNLPDPVVVNVRIQVENFINPRCVSYDFDQQEWVTEGCITIQSPDSNQITCECDHLTNFASLVDICTRTEEDGCGQNEDAKLALDIISIIGTILSGVGLILTILTLLLFKKLRNRDASKFHVQLSLALLAMLLVFVVGIDRTEVFEGCVTVSVLIHYFTLVAVMWMGAEALLMFQKLVIVFVQITTRYIIIVSLVCWLVPIVPAVLSAAIDPNLVVTDTETNKFCFIGDVRVFFIAFLGPIFAILLFNLVIYIIVIVVLIKHSRNKLGKAARNDKKQRKSNIRLAISLFGVMILFGLTWVLGAFTISEASLTFQILFAVFNSLQGFFIFIFFCLLSPDVRQLWLETVTCGRYVGSKSSSTSGVKKGYTSGPSKSGAKHTNANTASSGLSSLPSSAPYASESSVAIELSENPSSTVIGNDTLLPEEEAPSPSRKLPRVVGPPTSSHAHFYKNPGAENDRSTRKAASGLGAYESMRVYVEFKDDR